MNWLILIDIHYLQTPCSDYLTTALTTVVDIHNTQPQGDVLVFLTGQEEIDTLVQLLKDKAAELMESSNYKGNAARIYCRCVQLANGTLLL